MPRSSELQKLRREMGLWDLVLFNVVAVLGLRWLATAAAAGPTSIVLWLLAAMFFFVPQALTVVELSSRFPREGGIYAWTKRAFGDAHGFLCGWCYWLNNLFYFPNLLLSGAGMAVYVFGTRYTWLSDNTLYMTSVSLAVLWLAIGLNLVGLRTGKWLQNIGGLCTWIPGALVVLVGLLAWHAFGSANAFTRHTLVPDLSRYDTLNFWATIAFAFSGLELSATMSEEIREPGRNIPRAIAVSALAIAFIYILGTAAILVVLPAGQVNIITGAVQATEVVGPRLGLGPLPFIVAALLVLGNAGGVGAWVAGTARIPFVVGLDERFPAAFARVHPRWGTPHVAILVQGALATLFLLVYQIGERVQAAYQILVNLTIILFFIPYLYMFLALIRTRHDPARGRDPHEILVPGGSAGAFLIPVCGLLVTAFAIALALVPARGVPIGRYELKVLGGCVFFVVLGLAIYSQSRARHT